jgi:hypothetical protein
MSRAGADTGLATADPPITIDEAALQAGLGPMLADLLRQNLEQHPGRRADLARMRGTVNIEARDAAVAVTMDFAKGRLDVKGGTIGRPDVKIATDSLGLLELTSARLRGGVPDPTHPSGRRVLLRLLSGGLKIGGRGLILRPALLLRLNRLLNVAAR